MEQKLRHLYEDVFSLYTKLVQTTQWAETKVKENTHDMEYCADIAFAMYEINKLFEDMGVQIRKTLTVAELVACHQWITSSVCDEPIRTEHCTASVRTQIRPKMPPKGSPELKALLDWLGVKENHDAVRIHWPTLCELVTKRIAESKQIPACLNPQDMHNTSAKLQFYKKKGISE